MCQKYDICKLFSKREQSFPQAMDMYTVHTPIWNFTPTCTYDT